VHRLAYNSDVVAFKTGCRMGQRALKQPLGVRLRACLQSGVIDTYPELLNPVSFYSSCPLSCEDFPRIALLPYQSCSTFAKASADTSCSNEAGEIASTRRGLSTYLRRHEIRFRNGFAASLRPRKTRWPKDLPLWIEFKPAKKCWFAS
jgi:hypothetical protein